MKQIFNVVRIVKYHKLGLDNLIDDDEALSIINKSKHSKKEERGIHRTK